MRGKKRRKKSSELTCLNIPSECKSVNSVSAEFAKGVGPKVVVVVVVVEVVAGESSRDSEEFVPFLLIKHFWDPIK